MVFSSPTFIFFFLPAVLFLYHIARQKFKNYILLAFSLFFYAWGEPIYVLLMVVSIGVNYVLGRLIGKSKGRKSSTFYIFGAVFFNVALLFVFKYASFAVLNLNKLGFSFSVPSISLPIGISFFTFQAMSYVIDVYRSHVKVQKDIFNFALYVSFFPQLIAGPIVRYSDVETQLSSRTESFAKFDTGVKRFITGLFKKIVIANTAGAVYKTLIASGIGNLALMDAWLAIIVFAFQIYFDFSGYSDMAIGLAKMFGFDFLENFNYPYVSKSITEFWRRWHISLSTWFRDYVYIPLGGNRRGMIRSFFNLFIVWALTGLWHGAAWNFLIWGLYYCALLMIEKAFLSKILNRVPAFFQHFYTLLFVIIGWAIFKIENMPDLLSFLSKMFYISDSGWYTQAAISVLRNNIVILVFATLFATPLFKNIQERLLRRKTGLIVVNIVYVLIFIISISMLAASNYNPFIYFRF